MVAQTPPYGHAFVTKQDQHTCNHVIPRSSRATQAVRQGKQSKYVTSVMLSLLDADSQPAAVNITGIITNKASAGWQCECHTCVRALAIHRDADIGMGPNYLSGVPF